MTESKWKPEIRLEVIEDKNNKWKYFNTAFLNYTTKLIIIEASNLWIVWKNWIDWGDNYIDKYSICEVFRKKWSFVRIIWNALYLADLQNTFKLLDTFMNYVSEYFEDIIEYEKNYLNK